MFTQSPVTFFSTLIICMGHLEIAAPSQDLVTLLQAAIAKIKDISGGTGDPHLRLEKYLVRHYERSSAQAEARTFFASLFKTYPTSVVVALARVDFEM